MRKYKTRVKTELRKQQYTVTLFDRNHLAHSIVLQLYEKCNYYCVNVQFLLSCIFLYFQVRAPGGLYLEGPFKGGFFAFTSFFMGGGGLGGAYFTELCGFIVSTNVVCILQLNQL